MIATTLFILISKQIGSELLFVGFLVCTSVAAIAITNSSVIALAVVILSSLIYGVALGNLANLGTFMQGPAKFEDRTWRDFFDWNPTVHICVFLCYSDNRIVALEVSLPSFDRWLVVRYVLFVPVAFVLASIAAIPTIVYQTKYVDPQILFGQPAAPLTFYQIDGQKPYGAFSREATLLSNLYVSGKLSEYRFNNGREVFGKQINRAINTRQEHRPRLIRISNAAT